MPAFTTQDIIHYIMSYQNNWYLWPAMFFAAGIGIYLVLTMRVNAHVRGKAKLAWFIAPRFPRRMYIIGRRIYYDDEVEVIRGEDSYHLMTVYGEHYTTKHDPDSVAVIKNSVGARGPEGVDSPFSMAWRWIVASAITLYGVVLGLMAAWYDKRLDIIRVVEFFGYNIPANITAMVALDQSHALALASLLTALVFAWWLANLYRITVRGIKVMKYVPISVASSTIEIIPAVEPDAPTSVFKVLSTLVRDGIRLELGEGIKKIIMKLAKENKLDKATMVQLLNRAEMAEIWRMELGNRITEYQDVKDAGEAECQLKARELTPKLWANFAKILAATVLVSALVFGGIGYAIGAIYGVPHTQPANTTTTSTVTQPPVYYGNTTVTPAPMPPPPNITPTGGG